MEGERELGGNGRSGRRGVCGWNVLYERTIKKTSKCVGGALALTNTLSTITEQYILMKLREPHIKKKVYKLEGGFLRKRAQAGQGEA